MCVHSPFLYGPGCKHRKCCAHSWCSSSHLSDPNQHELSRCVWRLECRSFLWSLSQVVGFLWVLVQMQSQWHWLCTTMYTKGKRQGSRVPVREYAELRVRKCRLSLVWMSQWLDEGTQGKVKEGSRGESLARCWNQPLLHGIHGALW